MVFAKLNLNKREFFLIIVAVVVAGVVFTRSQSAKDEAAASEPSSTIQAVPAATMSTEIKPPELKSIVAKAEDVEPEDDAPNMKELRVQMESERKQLKEIKMLGLELEQVKLQYEREKTINDINKLRKDNVGYVSDGPHGGQSLSIGLTYIGVANNKKEAILVINGSNYSVKEGDRPISSILIEKITENNVVVKIDGDTPETRTISYGTN